ncbi:putative RNA-directed DNA polymerase from transposon X-element [Trichonephila clavipes]|nr:putative RNA-directed DNA polymerase from transposon X-element [Trichonephila clavipes]
MSVPSHPLKPFALSIGLNRLYEARSFNIKPFSERAKAVPNDTHLNNINIEENNILAFPPWDIQIFNYSNPFSGYDKAGTAAIIYQQLFSYHRTSQTDPNLSHIICPPFQCLTPISSKIRLPGTSSSVSTFSTSSSSTQDNLLPSPSGILPTIQSESLLQIPIPTTATTTSPGNNLNTLVSPLETETPSRTPPAKLNSVSTENLHESVPNESNSEHSTAAEAQQIVKRKSRNRRKRPKIQKSDIEIKRVPNRSRNATPTEITDDEDMITYDVEEEELEQDPFILPEGYLRALTPSRYRNYRE